jgi:glycosyltransferase involved in cell wall biosynthesis
MYILFPFSFFLLPFALCLSPSPFTFYLSAMPETAASTAIGAGATRPHRPWGTPGILLFVFSFFAELIASLPAILRLRFTHRAALRAARREDPWVVCVSDNLDEVNGIALASRIQLRELRRQGRKAFLFGTAFHTRRPRREGPDGSLVLTSGRYSIDQAGYDHSELVVPRLREFLAFLRENPVDVVELETPGPVCTQCLFAARLIGIRTLSHYRTDIIAYSEMLMKNRAGILFAQFWTRLFTRIAGPVIVPSDAYRDKVIAMGIPPAGVHKLPRGVDPEFFRPDLRDRAVWVRFDVPDDGLKLLYVGRVSVEKNLPALAEAFLQALEHQPALRLVVVGDGPYLEEMKRVLSACGRASFTGVLRDGNLARVFASADLFVFPSLADTFGNSVVEALASGLPCLVSDEGGPREIVVPGVCGAIFHHREPGALRDGILAMTKYPARLEAWREPARARAMEFAYEAAAAAFWKLYVSVWNEHRPAHGT